MPTDLLNLYAYILIAGFCATYLWRFLGLVFAERLNAESEILVWVRLVASGLMAALVTRMLFLPPGALATTFLSNRLIGFAMGVAAYLFLGQKLAVGVFTGLGVFMLLEIMQAGLITNWFG